MTFVVDVPFSRNKEVCEIRGFHIHCHCFCLVNSAGVWFNLCIHV